MWRSRDSGETSPELDAASALILAKTTVAVDSSQLKNNHPVFFGVPSFIHPVQLNVRVGWLMGGAIVVLSAELSSQSGVAHKKQERAHSLQPCGYRSSAIHCIVILMLSLARTGRWEAARQACAWGPRESL